MFKHLFFISIISLGGYLFWSTRPVSHGPGEVAPTQPVEERVSSIQPFQYGDYEFIPLRNIELEARVLSKKRYYLDSRSELAPYDLVLGWGPMSDERNLDHMLIKQSERTYRWEMTRPPIPEEQITSHSVNIQLVPSTDDMLSTIRSIRKGQVIRLKGYLIQIEEASGGTLAHAAKDLGSRSDANKIVWIENLTIL